MTGIAKSILLLLISVILAINLLIGFIIICILQMRK